MNFQERAQSNLESVLSDEASARVNYYTQLMTWQNKHPDFKSCLTHNK
jgi:hypothetical protein